ncbi:hypothetical protein IWT25_02155 [Secundilactobacillus pentosiphilus]|uniref:DUF6673 domain-containing protein n=1 Tax=Secundilactobacillus pentosiphilus TaxID=1714682 RepID=A0A1Z5IZ47_9LACO|nr:DUF6673 family protein [Secundilactobacillus pentosiphilus]GAX06808.1 hypothetical protein IWT25_02155 [Secundilactobacillus pentosiphilus]
METPQTIDLFGKPQNSIQCQLGSETKTLVFNDDFHRRISNVQLQIEEIQKPLLDDEKAKKLDDLPLNEQEKTISNIYAKLRSALSGFFDETFGEGTGKQIYEAKSGDSQAVMLLFQQFNELDDRFHKEEQNRTMSKYGNRKARRASNKGKQNKPANEG